MQLRITLCTLLTLSFFNAFAEGSKQLRPTSADFGYIQINDKARTFALAIGFA